MSYLSDNLSDTGSDVGNDEAPDRIPLNLESLPCAVYLVSDDPNLTVITANAYFYKLYGCTKENMRHKYADCLSAFISVESLKYLEELGEEKESAYSAFRQRIKRGGSNAWIYTQATRMRLGSSQAFCCVSFEITEEEKELQLLQRFVQDIHLAAKEVKIDGFEYYLATGEVKVYDVSRSLHLELLKAMLGNGVFPDMASALGLIHPEYIEAFKGAFQSIWQGSAKAVCDIRMKTVEDKYIWVRMTLLSKKEDAEERYVVGVLENIDQQKEMSLQYLDETQYFQAILSEMAAFAKVDVTEDHCTRFGGMWNLYNEIMDTVTYSHLIEEFINKVVHPEDRRHYLELMQRDNFIQSLENGIDKLGCEFRRIVEQNKMMWMELKVHLFRDPFTQHVLALVYIKNIDAKKKQELSLLRESERDLLTNSYNKKMAQRSIKDYIACMDKRERGALIILDLDDFKLINNAFGYKTGDQVLVRIAELLNGVFQRSDIIGRCGGDEFIIFIKNITTEEKVEESLNRLFESLRDEKAPEISCSAGVSMVSRGSSYGQIYRRAVIALHKAKKDGKARFVFYSGEDEGLEALVPENGVEDEIAGENMVMAASGGRDVSFDSFLAEQGEIAYLVDPDTFDLICGNKAFYDRIGMTEAQCAGIKCYEAMQKRESPCPFCSKANWSTDKFYLWRNLNAALEQEFLIKNKLVHWGGKEALLAIAVDLSNNKSIVDSMDNGAMESHSILSGIQRMTEAETLANAMKIALEATGYFFRAEAVRYWTKGDGEQSYRCSIAWTKMPEGSWSGGTEVNAWLRERKWVESIMIESPEAMLCHSYNMYQYMKSNGVRNQRWIELRDKDEEMGFIAIENISSNFQNVSFLESFAVFITGEIKKRKMVESILYANEHDDLTGLLSRNSYERYLEKYDPDEIAAVGVMTANFNNLKGINSTKGFTAGNYYLQEFADMLKNIFREDCLYRLNGDEFLAIAVDIDRRELEVRIQKLIAMIKKNYNFTVSIGYSWDDVEKNLAILIEQSTDAMKVDKRRHYDENPVTVHTERRQMLSELIEAIEKREFEVFLQPKVEISSNKVIGAEALIRYRQKDGAIITPDKFIKTLERNNLIRYIDLFVFEETCRILQKWGKADVRLPAISLNFSRLTLLERDIISSMEKIIAHYDVSRMYIEIEITESMASMGKSILYQAARELFEAGFNIALDDFGTEYTNLSILGDLEISVLKLDKSLIGTLADQKRNRIILKNIIYMCKDLGIAVIAEGVETKGQAQVLRSMDCRLAQGYLYGKPMPVEMFENQYGFPV